MKIYSDGPALKKVPLSRPDDDLVRFEGGKFSGADRNCKLGTLTRLHPETEIQPTNAVLSVEAFSIDRRTVSCVDFDRCTESGHCAGSERLREGYHDYPTDPRCVGGVAMVTHGAAEEYCKWRGMSLPTLTQWQRAIRGIDGRDFPAEATPSRERELLSPDGVIYVIYRESEEWLRDKDCTWMTKGGADAEQRFVAMPNFPPRLDGFGRAVEARIRCVREGEPTATQQ